MQELANLEQGSARGTGRRHQSPVAQNGSVTTCLLVIECPKWKLTNDGAIVACEICE